jgi:hypothetical protein
MKSQNDNGQENSTLMGGWVMQYTDGFVFSFMEQQDLVSDLFLAGIPRSLTFLLF